MPTPEIQEMFESAVPLGRVGEHIELALVVVVPEPGDELLDLAPGHYVAVGVRPGYRDVRQEFTVEIGASTLEPLSIVCTEVI